MSSAVLSVSPSPAAVTAVTRVERTGLFEAAVATGSVAMPSKLPAPVGRDRGAAGAERPVHRGRRSGAIDSGAIDSGAIDSAAGWGGHRLGSLVGALLAPPLATAAAMRPAKARPARVLIVVRRSMGSRAPCVVVALRVRPAAGPVARLVS